MEDRIIINNLIHFTRSYFVFTCMIFFGGICSISTAFRISKCHDVDMDHLISGKSIESLDQTKGVEWKLPQSCQIQNSSAAVTSVICKGAGFYPVSALFGHSNNETQYIQVRKSPLCYNWYVTTFNSSDNTHESDHNAWHLQVWITDPQHASTEESMNSAKQPSQSSKDITLKMSRRGQMPALEQKLKNRDQHLHIESTTFQSDYGYWTIEVNMQFHYEMLLMVKGKPEVAVNGCIVRDTPVVLSLPKFTNIPSLTTDADMEKLTGDPNGKLQLIQDPCTSSVALLIQRDAVILTQDSFNRYSDLYLPRQILLKNVISDPIVKTAAFSPNYLLLLIRGNLIALNKDTGKFKDISGLPSDGVEFLKGRHHCIPDTDGQLDPIHAIAWGANTQTVYMIYDRMKISTEYKDVEISVKLLQTLGFTDDFNVDIHDVAFHCSSGILGIVANVSNSTSSVIVILLYNTGTEQWSNMPFWIEDTENGDYSMMFLNTAESAFLFWSCHQMHYSYQNGLDVGTMEIQNRNTSMLGSSLDGDSIHQVTVSVYGDIVILMYPSNMMYYGRIHQHYLIMLPANHLPGIQQAVFFSSLGRFYSINNDSVAARQSYLLALHVAGTTYPNVCKYRHFNHNSTADVYYLDLGRKLILSATLTYPLHYFNTILVKSSSETLIEQQIVDSYEYYQGWQTLNKTIILESSASLYGVEDYHVTKADVIGDIILEMRPETSCVACKLPVVMNTHVFLGCPPGRHIRIHKPKQCQMPSQYTVPRSALQNADGSIAKSNMEVDYSTEVGCPIVKLYKDNFLPVIDLYDGDVFIEQVPANFILWEVHNRSDFSYTTTMHEAGCQSTAQTWDKMLQDSDEDHVSEDTWNQQNYKHCFSENTTAVEDLSLRYEILNSTGINRIRWKTWRNDSIFQFKLQVIDPEYSFCNLQASFGVRLLGLSPSHIPTAIIMRLSIGLFAVLTLSLGFVSYLIYRKIHIKEYQLQVASVDDEEDENGEVYVTGDEVPSVDIFNAAVTRKRHKVDE